MCECPVGTLSSDWAGPSLALDEDSHKHGRLESPKLSRTSKEEEGTPPRIQIIPEAHRTWSSQCDLERSSGFLLEPYPGQIQKIGGLCSGRKESFCEYETTPEAAGSISKGCICRCVCEGVSREV